jgi:hypothetical protein
LSIKKEDGSAAEWVLTAGQDKDSDVYLYTNQRGTVYKTDSSSLASIRVTPEYFRDGRRPFHFPLEQAQEIRVRNGAFHHVFKKDGSEWKLADGAAGDELDQEKLTTLLQTLGTLDAQEFLASGAGKGFRAEQTIEVVDSKGKTLFRLSWGDSYKAKLKFNRGQSFRYVKTNLEKDVMGLNAAKITSLVSPSLVRKKAKAK